jgi:UDP-N-acetylmuramoyl-L-alanyl-D-glutamate--2,6-diaminopimelate ligase
LCLLLTAKTNNHRFMTSKSFQDMIRSLPPRTVIAAQGDAAVTAPIVESSSDVQPGGLFVARRGRRTDGHGFIPQAIERGAAAIVGEYPLAGLPIPYAQVTDAGAILGDLAAAYFDFPSRRLTVIGVTGTDGKTTTSTLIHSILKAASGGKAGLISTITADLGGMTADTGLHVTTPGAPRIQSYLAQMADNGLDYAVIEATSHGLHQGRLNGIDLDVAVLTNLTHEHLDYHGTFENYRAAKAILFEMLDRSARKMDRSGAPIPKISVVNADDPNAGFFTALRADRLVRYGLTTPADFHADRLDFTPAGIELYVDGHTLRSPLVGRYNAQNILAAVAAARSLGVPWADDQGRAPIQAGLNQVTLISGRMERIDQGQPFLAIVDFAHTPNALKNALETCREMLPEGGQLIAVFGSAGLRDREKRRLMAEVSARLAHFTILTAEDPRTEPLELILDEMAAGCLAAGGVRGVTFTTVPDRGEAIFRACGMAHPGDIVIACGKGHEQSMAFGVAEYPWDDREAMRAALNGSPLRTLPTAVNGHLL